MKLLHNLNDLTHGGIMNNQLVLGKIVRRPKNGSYRLFEATINGEPCYCMTTPSQSEKIIFDRTESVLSTMKRVKSYYGKSKTVRIGFKEKRIGSVLFRIYMEAMRGGLLTTLC